MGTRTSAEATGNRRLFFHHMSLPVRSRCAATGQDKTVGWPERPDERLYTHVEGRLAWGLLHERRTLQRRLEVTMMSLELQVCKQCLYFGP